MLRLDFIKPYRLKYGLTQTEMANKIGISAGTLADIENEKAEPSLYVLQKICTFFDLDINLMPKQGITYQKVLRLIDQFQTPFNSQTRFQYVLTVKDTHTNKTIIRSNVNDNWSTIEKEKAKAMMER